MEFTNLKFHIAHAIKEACYRHDARLYNIANDIPNIVTFSHEPGIESEQDLSKIIDKTVKISIDLGCDLSVIVKGFLLGSFRSRPFSHKEAHKTIRVVIDQILQRGYKHKADTKQVIEGILASIVVIAMEFKINAREVVVLVREDIVSIAKDIDSKFADEIKGILITISDT